MYRKYFKRILDFIPSIILFVVLLPVFILVTIVLIFAMKAFEYFENTIFIDGIEPDTIVRNCKMTIILFG